MRRRVVKTFDDTIKENQLKLTNARIIATRDALKYVPRGVTLDQIRVCFIEHVLDSNEGNRTQTAQELAVNYSTLTTFLRGEGKVEVHVGRGRPRKHKAILEE
jgi:transcriptional regulator with PAS, ATPase and Fis domain